MADVALNFEPNNIALIFSSSQSVFGGNPEFPEDSALDVLSQGERSGFALRHSGKPIPLRCFIPRRKSNALIPVTPIVGTSSIRRGIYVEASHSIFLKSMYLTISNGEEDSPSRRVWSDMANRVGEAFCKEDIWKKEGSVLRIAQEFHAIWNPSEEPMAVDAMSMDPWLILEQEEIDLTDSDWLETSWPLKPRIVAVVANRYVDSQNDSNLAPSITSATVLEPGNINLSSNDPYSAEPSGPLVVLVLCTETPLPHPTAVDAAHVKLRHYLQRDIDLVTAHWHLLSSIDVVRSQLRGSLEDISSETSSASEFHKKLRRFWDYRLKSLAYLEHAWRINEPGFVDSRLAKLLETEVNLSERWGSSLREIDRICEAAKYFEDHPPDRIIDAPRRIQSLEVFSDATFSWKKIAELTATSRSSQRSKRDRGIRAENDQHHGHLFRTVQVHPFSNRSTILGSISARLAASTMLTATSGLLLGLLLAGSWGVTSSGPPYEVLLLFLSTFAFFFETLLLAHASREMAFTTVNVAARTEQANAVSLFLGQYPFVVALPLAITRALAVEDTEGMGANLSGNRLILSIAVSVLGLLMVAIYFEVGNVGKFSMQSYLSNRGERLDAHIFGDMYRRGLIGVLHLLAAVLLVDRIVGGMLAWTSWVVISLMICFLMVLTRISWAIAGLEEFRHYEVDVWDRMGQERAGFNDPDWE